MKEETGPPALNSRGVTALADRTLRDLVPVLDRYRPAALAATAIIVAVAVLPGAAQGSGIAAPAAFDAGFVEEEGEQDEGGSDEVASPTAPAAGGLPTPGTAPAPRIAPAAPAGSFTPRSSGSFDAPAPSPAPTPTGDPIGSDGPDTVEDEPEPLQIVAAAYASTTGGTPLPTEVPEGSLPVGARVDQVDKASYIRLSGSGSSLILTELADGRRGSDFESAPVQACQIIDPGWQPADNMSFDEAPAHDPDVCVPASMLPDGRWSIPLTMFADPTDDRGIALVPAPEAPIDFQVTFAATAAS